MLKFVVPAKPDVVMIGTQAVTELKPIMDLKPMSETESVVQELTQLWRLYEEHDMKQVCKRIEELKKQLQSIANEQMEDSKPAVFKCEGGEIEFSVRGESNEVVSPLALVQYLSEKFGPETAFSCVKIGLTELKKLLSENEAAQFLQKKPGSRTLKAVRLTKEGE